MKKTINILYIDDETANLRAFARTYSKYYDIQIAESAKEGLELIQHNNFHILLVDQKMPNITGVEFFSQLPKNQYAIKILLTAHTDFNDLIEAINKGQIFKYMNKPYKKEAIMKIITEAYNLYCFRKMHREDYHKYKAIFNNSYEPIFLLSKSGKIADLNASFSTLISASKEQIINKTYTDVFGKKNIIHTKLIGKLMNGEDLENIVVNFEVDNNKFIECLISLKQVNIDENSTIGYQVSIRNISDYKSMARALLRNLIAKQEKEKEQISFALHENTAQNLSAISLYMNILSSGDQSEEFQEMLNSSKEAINNTIKELRNMCFSLMPRSLLLDPESTLFNLCEKVKQKHPIECQLVIVGDLSILNEDLIIILFKKTQETLNHLNKTEDIAISIQLDRHNLNLEIEGGKIKINQLEVDNLYTEIDSYNGKIAINLLQNKRIQYWMSFPI
jgi:two-component system sensor histidine kinase/response regulator